MELQSFSDPSGSLSEGAAVPCGLSEVTEAAALLSLILYVSFLLQQLRKLLFSNENPVIRVFVSANRPEFRLPAMHPHVHLHRSSSTVSRSVLNSELGRAGTAWQRR